MNNKNKTYISHHTFGFPIYHCCAATASGGKLITLLGYKPFSFRPPDLVEFQRNQFRKSAYGSCLGRHVPIIPPLPEEIFFMP
jgi:hypothetical protein